MSLDEGESADDYLSGVFKKLGEKSYRRHQTDHVDYAPLFG